MFTPKECEIRSVKWDGEGTVIFDFDGGDGLTGFSWMGAKRKDFWHPDHDWEAILKPGVKIKMWTVQFSSVVGFQWFDPELDKWDDVWCVVNDFPTKAERKKSEDDYFGKIDEVSKVITKELDGGAEPESIMKLFDDQGYTGNMVFHMVRVGAETSANKEACEAMRLFWNAYWGDTSGKPGWLNPAIINIQEGGDSNDDGADEDKAKAAGTGDYIFEGGVSETEK